ncbi:vascular cell adhesion protein 1b [Chanos chanos]|uniref:Vascular cell adhesion protein 1b n=1 Tax=Chanos chanos TaxID=29144 RepID=A0A6J2WQ81_CHACN|nr:vascular cell adhesion protein 1 [Chanos chanos]
MLSFSFKVQSFDVELTPKNAMWRVGDKQQLTCKVKKCSEPVIFSWKSLEDKPLYASMTSTSEESVLLVEKVTEHNENRVQCLAKCGSVSKQRSASIKVYSFPNNPVISGHDDMVLGVESTLTCEVSDVYPVEEIGIEWLAGDNILSSSDGSAVSTLSLTPTTELDGDKITCRVTLHLNGLQPDETRETTVTMSVLAPLLKPSIDVSPKTEIEEGESLTISCHTDGVKVDRVVLRRVVEGEEMELQSNDDTDTSVTIHPAQMNHTGLYECEASNQYGSQKASVNITVRGYPLEVELIPNQSLISAEKGSSLVLSCQASGCPQPEFFWKSLLDMPVHSRSETQGFLSQLYLSPLRLEDERAYTCEVKCGSVLKSKVIDVQVFSFPQNPVIEHSGPFLAGHENLMKCSVPDAFPGSNFQIQWMAGERELSSDIGSFSSEPQNLTSTLRYTPEPEDQGKDITCRVTLAMRGLPETQIDKSASTVVMLQSAPKNTFIAVDPENEVKEGEPVTISCHTDGVPVGRVVLRRMVEDQEMELQSSDSAHSSITIPSAQMNHSGLYECVASNEHGTQKARVNVTVRAPPRNTTVEVLPSVEVQEGQNITIFCHSVCFPPPATLLRNLDNNMELHSPDGTFHLINLTSNHTGLYVVNVSNDLGFDTVNFTIRVTKARSASPPTWENVGILSLGLGTAVVSIAGVLEHLRRARKKGSYELTKCMPSKV